ncbi:PEGA domain-containing protein [bacterium]|nr:PEGA domain-containing protein [bacterium]
MSRRRTYAQLSVVMIMMMISVGCVERRLTVRSVPANALVLLDGQEIGFTPCSVPFDYYGDRQIRLIKDGYETRTINQTIAAPWYQWIGIDFVSEVLVPWRIRDDRNYVYELEPTQMVSSDELMQRAAQVREQGRQPPERILKRAGVVRRGRAEANPEPLTAPEPPLGN